MAARGLDPRDARPVFYLGEVARARSQWPVAEARYGEALGLDATMVEAMVLDLRFLAGDRGLADALRERSAALRGERELATFIDALADELRERHERFGATVYLLEPDVKLGRGGLRDLDIIRWALRARVRALGLGRMKAAGSAARRAMRVLSPRMLPPVRLLLGSMASTATR